MRGRNTAQSVLPKNINLNGKYIIGYDPISNTSKGAMVVCKYTDKGIEIISVSRMPKYPWINKLRFKWMMWMLFLKYFRKIKCVKEKGVLSGEHGVI